MWTPIIFMLIFLNEPYLNFNYYNDYPVNTTIEEVELRDWKGNIKRKKEVAFFNKISVINDKKLNQHYALLTRSKTTLYSIFAEKIDTNDSFHKDFRLKIDSIYEESLSYLYKNFEMTLEMKQYKSQYKNQKRALHKGAGDDEKTNRFISEYNMDKANEMITQNYQSVWDAVVVFNELIVDFYSKPTRYARYCSEEIDSVMLQIEGFNKSF